jgi:catechol 2,3-dioxygenase-like lactoylglutathione lyase family enzyme
MQKWYARPVLFVADLQRALHFYVDDLGFAKDWHEGDGEGKVCQISRAQFELILCEDPQRPDKARMFVELNKEELAQLRAELASRSIPSKTSWWGYDVIQIDDPDGNEWLFPLPEAG